MACVHLRLARTAYRVPFTLTVHRVRVRCTSSVRRVYIEYCIARPGGGCSLTSRPPSASRASQMLDRPRVSPRRSYCAYAVPAATATAVAAAEAEGVSRRFQTSRRADSGRRGRERGIRGSATRDRHGKQEGVPGSAAARVSTWP